MSLSNYLTMQNQSVTGAAVLLTFSASMITGGTGAVWDQKMVEEWKPYFESHTSIPIESTIPLNSPNTDIRTAAQHVENIRHVFNIPISNIADILHVSRQAVYKWLTDQSLPEQDKHNTLRILSRAADKFQASGVSRAGALLKIKAFDGRSLIDVLLAGENIDEYVVALIKEAKIMDLSYEKSGLSKSKAKPTNDWQSDISIPGFPEEK